MLAPSAEYDSLIQFTFPGFETRETSHSKGTKSCPVQCSDQPVSHPASAPPSSNHPSPIQQKEPHLEAARAPDLMREIHEAEIQEEQIANQCGDLADSMRPELKRINAKREVGYKPTAPPSCGRQYSIPSLFDCLDFGDLLDDPLSTQPPPTQANQSTALHQHSKYLPRVLTPAVILARRYRIEVRRRHRAKHELSYKTNRREKNEARQRVACKRPRSANGHFLSSENHQHQDIKSEIPASLLSIRRPTLPIFHLNNE